ncbi:hypothetical protein GCM10018785_42550 [Streptomyces longispororuber]|uniref:Uncharacterized protein n=1 Tax=Streptomyces longispororuber TaxID=68230 RepID=A0A918ZTM2_9ACTN|nr:hypothetical protein GCM10018785_42550 [Streptomyces longispororuber]
MGGVVVPWSPSALPVLPEGARRPRRPGAFRQDARAWLAVRFRCTRGTARPPYVADRAAPVDHWTMRTPT